MVYYRNYSPEYTNSEEFTEYIEEYIKYSDDGYLFWENEYKYNCRAFQQNIQTDHWTLFYTININKDLLFDIVQKWLDKGYYVQIVPAIEKSIKIPHIHFIKNTT